ncbi:HET-domain-containing protein [Hypoxylon sp. NC0597]|nr:HET-domain-containing protein [Hypoxylon sp. NC0597]
MVMEPRDLVCAKCWRDFFHTDAFEQCCTGPTDGAIVEATSTVHEIRNAALSGCTWCSYINEFIRPSLDEETRVTVLLGPSLIKSCTPEGRNTFRLSISCHSPAGKWEAGASLFLHAFTTAEDKAAEYVTARPLRTDIGSEAAFCQIEAWLRECEGHKCCPSSYTQVILPTRIIEVSPPGQEEPRLLKSRGIRGVYATLSYCWGADPFQTLSKSNYAQFAEKLDMGTLPLTIRDAITITRKLCIPYIWIDALCIIQDSESDKMREISQMKDIYASSAVTIVAASSKGVSEGFLHDRHRSEITYTIPFRIRPGLFGTMSVNELDAATYDERLEPLAKRAWTMQEQILAQRTITFATYTMLWSCKAGTRNFGNSLYFPHDLDAGYNDNDEKYDLNLSSLLIPEQEAKFDKDRALSCWLRLVTAYSLRTASVECDKLNAIAGIASLPSFISSLGPGYFSGMWGYKLARQLTWYTSDWHRTLSEDESFDFYRPTTYRAPSWSWASLEGGIIHFDFSFDDEDEPEPEIICEIKECLTTLKFPDLNPFGEVLSGCLRLSGPLRRAWLNPLTSNVILLRDFTSEDHGCLDGGGAVIPYEEAWEKHIKDFKADHPDIDLKEDPEAVYGTDDNNTNGRCDESGATQPVIVYCCPITLDTSLTRGVTGLLLTLVSNEDGNLYKRIGRFTRGKIEDFENLPKRGICVV